MLLLAVVLVGDGQGRRAGRHRLPVPALLCRQPLALGLGLCTCSPALAARAVAKLGLSCFHLLIFSKTACPLPVCCTVNALSILSTIRTSLPNKYILRTQ